jgi:MFS family permease
MTAGAIPPLEPGPPTRELRTLWRHGDFMRLWTGQTISLIGSQVTLLALPLTAILLFDATAFQVGALNTLLFLPFLLFGLPAGVWVDRARRKPVMVAADVGRFVVLGSVPVAYWLGILHLGQIFAVGFVTGVLTVFFDVAYGAYLPSLIPRGRLIEGNAKLEISRSGAQIAGPGLAGLLVQWLSAPAAIMADAVSYLASVGFLLGVRTPEPRIDRPEAHPPMWHEVRGGLGYVLGHPLLRPLAISTGTLNLASGFVDAVILLFAVRDLELTAGQIGLILALGNVGFLVGAILSTRIGRWLGTGPAIIGGAVAIAVGFAVVPLATASTAVPVLLAYGLVASFGGVVYNVLARSTVQTVTPDPMLGRTIATLRFFVWGTIPLGSLLGGVLGTALGLRSTLWIGAACGLLAFLGPLLSPVRRLRTPESALPADPDV